MSLARRLERRAGVRERKEERRLCLVCVHGRPGPKAAAAGAGVASFLLGLAIGLTRGLPDVFGATPSIPVCPDHRIELEAYLEVVREGELAGEGGLEAPLEVLEEGEPVSLGEAPEL